MNYVLTKRSKSEPLIQIAGLVAGAVFRRDARGESDAYEKIQGKFVELIEYQESNPPRQPIRHHFQTGAGPPQSATFRGAGQAGDAVRAADGG
jgi:hypothetical protein